MEIGFVFFGVFVRFVVVRLGIDFGGYFDF